MPRTYIEAFDHKGEQILGNLDGQASLNVIDYRRTKAYKYLSSPDRPRWPRVRFWRAVRNGRPLSYVYNPYFDPTVR